MNRPKYEQAPAWVPAPCRRSWTYELLLIHSPDEDIWSIAKRDEIVAVQDPDSFMGKLLRDHAALMSLPYSSNN